MTDYEDSGDTCEETKASYPEAQAFSAGMHRRENRIVTHQRRIELQNFARKIAADVLEHTKPHERCLLRRMTEELLPGEE